MDTSLSEYVSLAIGFCVTVGGSAIGTSCGGSLNSTFSFGILSAHVLGGGAFVNGLVYIVFELVGGALAVGMFMATHVAECVPKGYGARNMSFKRIG